jgi:hypothetical protein
MMAAGGQWIKPHYVKRRELRHRISRHEAD